MQTITVEITNNEALKVLQDLQRKEFIKILGKSDSNSAALPGKPLSVEEFQDWVAQRENGPTVSLQQAKAVWAKQRSQLQKLAQ
ncbi:MAG: hypothetical protein EON51_14830 [Acinetobacter sp.]|nr:MAG: hypothetical protein EON51_14830 [Acinetobacter sp.]